MAESIPRTTTSFPLAYGVLAAMGVLAAWMGSRVAGAFVPTWRAGFFWLGASAAVISAVVLREALARERPRGELRAALYARELIILAWATLPVTLLLRYLPFDVGAVPDLLTHIWTSPGRYIDLRDLITVFLFLGSWALVLRPLQLLERLHVRSEDLPKRRTDVLYEDSTSSRLALPDLGRMRQQLTNWVIGWLFVFGIAVGVTWQSLQPAWQVMSAAALVGYTCLGLVLLALTNFELRQSRWVIESVSSEGVAADRFASVSGQLVSVLFIIALLIPAGIVLFLIRAVLGAIIGALSALLSLWKTPAAQPMMQFAQRPVMPRPPFLPPASAHTAAQAGPSYDFLQPLLVALGVGVALLIVWWLVRWWQRGEGGPRLRWLQALASVTQFFTALASLLRELVKGVRTLVEQGAQQVAAASSRAMANIRGSGGPRDGSPSSVVRYWYGQLVRSANDAGISRTPGGTATEFRSVITSQVTETDDDVQQLTQAYVTARYSQEGPSVEDADRAKDIVQRMRVALRQYKRDRQRARPAAKAEAEQADEAEQDAGTPQP